MILGENGCKKSDTVFSTLRPFKLIPGVSKKVLPFVYTRKRNDKISGLLEFIGIFVYLQLECTYLVF